MKISTIGELEVLSKVNQDVFNTLADLNISRKKAAWALDDAWNIQISEKLVRTFRDNLKAGYSTLAAESVLEKAVKATPTNFLEPVAKVGKVQSSKIIVIMPDVQAPLHDANLVDKFIDFLEDYQPTELAQVGDFTDSTEISRWVRGKKGEYAGDLQHGFDVAMDILDDIRCVFDGRFRIVRSNHDDRLELYIEGCAPGLSLRDLTIEKQLRLADFDVEFVRDGVVELIKDQWIMGHGDEGSLSPQAGKTAFGLAKNKFGVNVVCGHTHRAGETTESYGYNGQVRRTLTGLEVGHFMDLKQAAYLDKKGGTANWQQAFGILETIHGKTFHRLITVNDGEFVVDGELY